MDSRSFLGLESTHNRFRWKLPVTRKISVGENFLFGGCGLAAAISALEGTSSRRCVWATGQYLSYANPGEVVDIDITIAVEGHAITQARAVCHVADREILTVNAALGERDRPPPVRVVLRNSQTPPYVAGSRRSREVVAAGTPTNLTRIMWSAVRTRRGPVPKADPWPFRTAQV